MVPDNENVPYSSHIDPSYSDGSYFSDSKRGASDAAAKAGWVLGFTLSVLDEWGLSVETYADVGCGAGHNVRLISEGLRKRGVLRRAAGYDVSPHVTDLKMEGIDFYHQDFCRAADRYDLVTLLDVFEHVPETADFIKAVARRAKVVVFHIPLDGCLLNRMRNEFHRKLKNPGHLIYLNPVSALNLITLSGLRILDYRYTFAFEAPSGRATFKQRAVYPARKLLAALNPYLLASTLGGVSLLVAARSSDFR